MTFHDLQIIEPIKKALSNKNYKTPSPIQAESIPVLLSGRDILASAQTGTGKTASFAIPILQNLQKEPKGSKKVIKALVLAPTRELALQIYENFLEYGEYLDTRTAVIFGGVPQARQIKDLKKGVDVLIATPGRLLDLMQQGEIDLSSVSYFVLDEADRMLDMGFVKDVKKIVKAISQTRQSMLFSATMPKSIMNLAHEILNNPVRVQVAPVEATIDKIKQSLYYVSKKKKINLLVDLLQEEHLKSVLVFSRTKHGANKIAKQLVGFHIPTEAIHGNKSQSARQASLAAFKTGKIRVLVATDIAARGIDIDDLSHVINYDLPEVPETYIHRIGRTGRAGQGGDAISFCSEEELNLLKDIEKHMKVKLPVNEYNHSDKVASKLEEIRNQKSRLQNKKSSNPGKKKSPYQNKSKGNTYTNQKPSKSKSKSRFC